MSDDYKLSWEIYLTGIYNLLDSKLGLVLRHNDRWYADAVRSPIYTDRSYIIPGTMRKLPKQVEGDILAIQAWLENEWRTHLRAKYILSKDNG